jgi:hypothetical protein
LSRGKPSTRRVPARWTADDPRLSMEQLEPHRCEILESLDVGHVADAAANSILALLGGVLSKSSYVVDEHARLSSVCAGLQKILRLTTLFRRALSRCETRDFEKRDGLHGSDARRNVKAAARAGENLCSFLVSLDSKTRGELRRQLFKQADINRLVWLYDSLLYPRYLLQELRRSLGRLSGAALRALEHMAKPPRGRPPREELRELASEVLRLGRRVAADHSLTGELFSEAQFLRVCIKTSGVPCDHAVFRRLLKELKVKS